MTDTNIGSIYFVVRVETEHIAKFGTIMKILRNLNMHMKTFKDINN